MTDKIFAARWVVTGVADRHNASVLDDGAVLVRDGTILATGTLSDVQAQSPDAPVTRYGNHVMLPGFVNSHHHVGLTPLQLGSPDHPLETWFATRIPARTIDAYLDTLYSAFEMIASGITTVQHIHGWMAGGYEAVHGAASKVLRAYRDIGMRASYCYAVREQNRLVYEDDEAFCSRLPQPLADQLRAHLARQAMKFEDFMRLFGQLTSENEGQRLTRIQLAPANLHWVSDDGLRELNRTSLASGVPMHMHLLETAYQKEYAQRRTGTTAVAHLERLGLLGPHLTLGHGVWLNEADIEMAAGTGTCICHNCSSNFRLRSGVAAVNEFERRHMTVGLGLDEAGINDDRDMLQEMRLVLRAHRVPGMDDDVPTSPQVLRMATEAGALTTAFGADIGKLEPGRFFDASLIDWHATTFPYQDDAIPLVDVVVQRAKASAVTAVYVDGECILERGRFTRIDRDAVLAEIEALLAKPRSPEEEARKALGLAVTPHVKQFYQGYIREAPQQPFYAPSSRR